RTFPEPRPPATPEGSRMPAKHVKSRREDRDYEDLVRLYHEDVGRHDMLTKDDEVRLAQAIEAGVAASREFEAAKKLTPTQRRQLRRGIRLGEEAHRQFVNSNLRLVVSIAKKYQSTGLPLLDIVEVLRYAVDTVSLDEPVRDDGDAELGDFVEDRNATAPFDAAAVSLLPGEVAKVLKVLDERERTILCLRFGLDGGGERTLEEVAEYFGLTRERIRQIEARAMSKLRHPS